MTQNPAEMRGAPAAGPVTIGPLRQSELPEAERILRVAFGTFLGAPDPEAFWSDRDYVYGRSRAPHCAALGAMRDGQLLGSNFVTRWGSVGFFGPITVRPDVHEQGIAKALLAGTMAQLDAWGTTHAGLFTFAQSAKHVGLYQKFGFHARFLTAIMRAPAADRGTPGWARYSALGHAAREQALAGCREVAESLYPGLDLTQEIKATHAQDLGDTVLVEGASGIAAFAICHYGPRSEAGADTCFIKFGAVRDSPSARRDYARLLDAVETLAARLGIPSVLAGANLGRHEAYQDLLGRGYRTAIQGVAMHRDNDPGYSRPDAFVIDDWR
jgi:GNAT superfamily N-acetyltransferase